MRLAARQRILAAILLTIIHCTKGLPMISDFSPPYGPLFGRTSVTINITDVQGYNVTSIQLADVNARISNITHGANSLSVQCESGKSSSLISEVITVTLLHNDGSRDVIRSSELYSYKPNPELYKMENNAVIRSGGIRLWVTGMNLLSVMSPVMVIQRVFQGKIMKFNAGCEAYNNTKMSCISPNLKMEESTTTVTTIQTTVPSNPSSASTTSVVQPQTSDVPSKSTFAPQSSVKVTQASTSPIWQSTLTSTIKYTRISMTSQMRQSKLTSAILHTKPSITTTPIKFPSKTTPIMVTKIPIFLQRRRRQAQDDKPEYFANFQMDGIKFSNFSRILVYDDPVFHKFDEKDNTKTFFPAQETEIVIKGERLSLALQPDDIKVYIGEEDCPVTSLVANQLTCTPPSTEPSGQDKHRVLVEAGTTLEYFVGHLSYGDLQESKNVPKMLMLILIGAGVLIFWIFVFCIVCYITRRKKRVRSKHSSSGSNNSTGHTYLTDNGSDTDSQGIPFMGTMFNTDPLDILPPDLRHKVIQCRIDSNRLHVGQCIGTGTYGRVFRGTLLDEEDSLTVAVKTLKRVSVYYEREMTDFLHEALIMKDLRHPNIIHLYGVVIFNYAPFVVFECMDLGDLRTYIKTEKNLPLKQLLTFALQIAHALTYLTSQNFVHMDVAARNCLINSNMKVKLGDFGLSRDLHGLDYYKLADKAKPMPVKWMALESLQWGRFTSHSDVWSFGVLLWELLTRGQRPYEAVDNMDIKAYIASGQRLPQPKMADHNLFNIMNLAWREDPSSRPTFEEMVIKIQEAINGIRS